MYNEEIYNKIYPLTPERCAIFHEVMVMRGPEEEGYGFLDNPFKIDVLIAAGPTLVGVTEEQLDLLLNAAAQHAYDVLVLSAFGCGTCGHNSTAMVRLFRKSLSRSGLMRVIFATIQ
jgi:hypothetical protein